MPVRLEPKDEYTHELGPETHFNESMYFNVYDPAAGVGGFFRLGNRANEGVAEMTVCLYLPDCSVAFMFARPEIRTNDAFESGGLRMVVVRPFEELTVTYSGKVVLLTDPLAMAKPRTAFRDNPWADCKVELTYTRVSDMFGGEPDTPHERPGEEFAKGHYEQLVAASGAIRLGDESWDVTGFGLRDHSWGPRTWQAPWYYRWLTCNAGPDFGFMASRVARRDGEGTRGGFVWEDGCLHLCHDVDITTAWTGEATYHDTVDAKLSSKDKQWRARGEVMSLVPLRNRRTDPEGNHLLTRISEGMTEWVIDGNRVGYGLSEYLDQIVDGQPVGR